MLYFTFLANKLSRKSKSKKYKSILTLLELCIKINIILEIWGESI